MIQNFLSISAASKKATLFIVLFIFVCTKGFVAQTTSFITYGVEEGLVQSQIKSLVQDNDGSLWIGTLAGLSRYDGRTFENFTKKDGLVEDWITVSYKDSKGDLWFGHWAGGVSKFNSKLKKFESLNLEEYTHFHTITAIKEYQSGFFWIGTEGSGVFIYDPSKNKMFGLNVKDGIASSNVFALELDKSGNMWIATDRGITICDTKGDISSPTAFVDLTASRGFPSNSITSFALTNKGTEMWVGTGDTGLIVLQIPPGFVNRNAPTLIPSLKIFASTQGLGANFVETVCEDSRGNVWAGTLGGGATKITPKNSQNRLQDLDKSILKNYNTRQGLNYFNVHAIIEDREGNIWIGTDVGLNQYRGERFQLIDKQDGLNNDIVWASLVDHSGNVWLGTNDGLSCLTYYSVLGTNEKRFTVKNYFVQDGLGSNVILSLFEDESNTIWVGTGFGGVSKLVSGASRFQTYSKADGLANDVVYAINSDTKGNIWVGTQQGVSKINPLTKSIRNYTTEDGLGGDNIYKIFRDSHGSLWFGALGGYLSFYDGKSFTKYDESSGIVHRFILSINEDKNNNIWFGVYGGGLYKYDGRTFSNFNVKNGMSTDSPYAIISDRDGNIWIGNGRGLDKFTIKDSSFFHYGRQEGFLGVEVNPNAVAAAKDGSLWFGTIMGAVKFDPNANYFNAVEPLTKINSLKIFMRDADFPDEGKFNYDQNHLTFGFVGISLTNPEKIKYKYKLQGFDSDWSPVPTHHNEAVYSNLPPGEYIFMVMAANNDGTWNKEPVKYKFFIKPPFWQTATFYIFMTLFILFSIFGIDKMRTRKLNNQKKILEAQVVQRTLELALKNEELAQKNREITDSIQYAKRLQDKMLLPSRLIKKEFPSSFLFYKPKDIVSGDFYFFRKCNIGKKNKMIIAAVDCTGHGVPGAFMSVVANDMLAHLLDGHAQDSPALLLDRLKLGMQDKMGQTIGAITLHDGLDIALISIDLDAMELEFAGAFCPMYVFRGKQFTEYKPDKISIGIFSDGEQKKYTNHKVQLLSGDTLYLFSDGYADQFGGAQGKKFKLSQFKATLLNFQDENMHTQYTMLEKTMDTWRGSHEQVDDMLVIGIRI